MPRQFANGLQDLLARKDKNLETHSTLELSVIGGAIPQNYYFATAKIEAGGIVWQPQLRKVSSIKASLTRTTNQATVDLQNVDTVLGLEFTRIQDYLSGATAKVGRYWKDHDSGSVFHELFLSGIVAVPPVSQDVVSLTVVADMYSGVSVGARRRMTRICQWRFRQEDTCGYDGVETECNLLINSNDGCQGRHGDPLKLARYGGHPYIDPSAKLVTI
jgi:hypothetical protein